MPYRIDQASGERVVWEQLQVQGCWGRYKILLVHSVRKPWVPDEAGLAMLKQDVGEKLVALVIGEIKKNNHKAIILSFVLCFRRQEGEGWWRAHMQQSRGGSLSDDSQVLGRLSRGSPRRASCGSVGGGPRLRNCLYFSGKVEIRSCPRSVKNLDGSQAMENPCLGAVGTTYNFYSQPPQHTTPL